MSGSKRIEESFARCRAEGRGALVTYVMGGDPDVAGSARMALACVEGGADLLEIGVPFSDPIADGPTIQLAAERALRHRTSPRDCLAVVRAVRAKSQVPVALMGYLNPILAAGLEGFVAEAAAAGVDALIIPDLLPEESGELAATAARHGLALVFLVAPTSTPARVEAAARAATGFVYFVSVTGVTGARAELPADLAGKVKAVREASRVPVVIGFGVSTPEQARALGRLADGVVVGSAIVSRVAAPGPVAARASGVARFVRSLAKALR
ncbi:MAG TPA: tryptophan synthase subunit alpha [Anaeromyxobacteraceae bacterium]|nr:tryptophan synthase subunit alpha [Anaeromyxobacteraceae bacterium]